MIFNDIYDSARPYIACFVVLKNDQGKIAMLKRANTGWMDGYYGLPAGKVEYGETYAQAAVREALEEAGIVVAEKDLSFVHIVHRHGVEGLGFMDWVDVYFEAKQWEGNPYNAETHKASEFAWIDIDAEGDMIVPAQYSALQAYVLGELYSEYGWKG